jgi:hypothetical protein
MRILLILLISFFPILGWSQLADETKAPCNDCRQSPLARPTALSGRMLDMTGLLGFNSLHSDGCKPQSAIAKQSVMRMVLPAGETASISQVMGRDDLETHRTLIESIRADKSPPPSTNDINIWELENCIKNRIENCTISTAYRSSTIVLIGDGSTALTAFHNLKLHFASHLNKSKNSGQSAIEAGSSLSRIHIPVFLYNSEGVLIGQPTDIRVHVTDVTPAQIQEARKNLGTKQMASFADSAKLSFSRSVGKGVKIAAKAPASGEILRIFGFPDKTRDWQEVGGADSDGSSMFCTVGPTVSLEIAAQRFNWNVSGLSLQEQTAYRDRSVFTASASFGGMSGGAVFNERGELVATHSSGSNTPFNSTTANTLIPEISPSTSE